MRLVLCLVFFGSAAVALGQSQSQTPQAAPHLLASVPPANVQFLGSSSVECPVGMTAERQASGQTEWVISLEDAPLLHSLNKARTNHAGVRVELIGLKSRAMKQAEVEVDYLAPGTRLQPVQAANDDLVVGSSLKKTFVLSAAEGAGRSQLAGSLLMDNAASITRVRLLRVEYTDGSTWQTERGSNCSVEPGLLMAVAGH